MRGKLVLFSMLSDHLTSMTCIILGGFPLKQCHVDFNITETALNVRFVCSDCSVVLRNILLTAHSLRTRRSDDAHVRAL